MQLKLIAILSIHLLSLLAGVNCFAANKIDINTMKSNLANTAPNTKFYESCNGEEGTCINTFSKTQVQMMQAVALAQEYAKIKYGHDIICSAVYRTNWNDDYIKCSTQNGTPVHYEFQFDDVKESIDSTIQKNVADALCTMYHGFYNGTCSIQNKYINDLKSSTEKFGYQTVCNSDNAINTNHSICSIIFGTKDAQNYKLKTAFGIDPRKFINLQLQSAADMDFLLKRYTQRQVESSGQTLTQFECASSFQTYKTGDTLNPKDDIISCTANGKQIDFLFDDINEAFDYQAKAGTAGLTCIADSGGTFDGRSCHGLTQEQCNALNTKIPGGTTWDTTLDTCVLNDAASANNINQFVSDLTAVGIATGFVVATILTGGGTILVVASAAGAMGTAVSITSQGNKRDAIYEFLANSATCKESACAEATLNNFIKEISYYYDDIDGQLLHAVDDELARLLELIPADSNLIRNAISNSLANTNNISNFADWPYNEKLDFAGKVLSNIGAAASIMSSMKTGWQAITSILKNRQPTPRTINFLVDSISGIDGGKTITSYSAQQ